MKVQRFVVLAYWDHSDTRRETVEAICETLEQALDVICEVTRREATDCLPHFERSRMFVREMSVQVIG